jgi:hypothetical protein
MGHLITYRYGPGDYIALLRAQRSLGPLERFGRWGRYVCFALLFVIVIDLFDYEIWSNNPMIGAIVSGILFLMFVLLAPVGEFIAERALALWIFPRHSMANKDITLEFGDDGVCSKYSGMEGRIPWRAIRRMLDTRDHLFLFGSRAESMVVPKRALPSPDTVAELAHYIRSNIDAAAAG